MKHGLRLNLNKIEFLKFDSNEKGFVAFNISDMLRARINVVSATSMKWNSTTGVLSNRRINERRKPKMYSSAVRTAPLYEYWPTMKDNERHFAIIEMEMLHIREKHLR